MRIRTNGRSGLLLAAGLLVGFTAPMAGASSAASIVASDVARAKVTASRPAPRHLKNSERLTTVRAAPGKAAQKASIVPQAAASRLPTDRRDALDIPPSVANANAQLTSTQAARKAMPLQADPSSDAENANVAPDPTPGPNAQLPASQAMHSVAPLAAASAAVVSSADTAASGTRPSLIGSICIGIGALLTMTSAARLYIVS